MVKRKKQKQSIKGKTRRKMYAQQQEMDRILKEIEEKLTAHFRPRDGVGVGFRRNIWTSVEQVGGIVGRAGYSYLIKFSTQAYVSTTVGEMARYDPNASRYADNDAPFANWVGGPAYKRGNFKCTVGIHCTLETVDREVRRAIHSFHNEFKSRARKLDGEDTDDQGKSSS